MGFFLDIGHKLFKNTILDVMFLVCMLFRLISILNLSFPYITCNFVQKWNAIDKDLPSAKLAEEINADIVIIASDAEGAAIHCGNHIKIIGGTNVKEKSTPYRCSRKRFPQF
ncbi:MAG: hypothetical protein GQ555_03665 [Desulfobacterales bacterium]|nr:hypothetical protein [Desulfobacterales bacterium]